VARRDIIHWFSDVHMMLTLTDQAVCNHLTGGPPGVRVIKASASTCSYVLLVQLTL